MTVMTYDWRSVPQRPDAGAVAAWRARQWSPNRLPVVSMPAARRPLETASPAPSKWSYRVLVPARDATATETPAGAAQLASKALANGGVVRCTYALAERLDEPQGLVASVAVRVRVPGRGRGFTCWHNGRFDSAAWWPVSSYLRPVNLGQFAALVAGEPEPAPRVAEIGPCPRCSRPVRFTAAGNPYKHSKTDTKEVCE